MLQIRINRSLVYTFAHIRARATTVPKSVVPNTELSRFCELDIVAAKHSVFPEERACESYFFSYFRFSPSQFDWQIHWNNPMKNNWIEVRRSGRPSDTILSILPHTFSVANERSMHRPLFALWDSLAWQAATWIAASVFIYMFKIHPSATC